MQTLSIVVLFCLTNQMPSLIQEFKARKFTDTGQRRVAWRLTFDYLQHFALSSAQGSCQRQTKRPCVLRRIRPTVCVDGPFLCVINSRKAVCSLRPHLHFLQTFPALSITICTDEFQTTSWDQSRQVAPWHGKYPKEKHYLPRRAYARTSSYHSAMLMEPPVRQLDKKKLLAALPF